MFEAYKISVAISLTNHVSQGLAMMSGEFAKTEAQATLLQKRINGIKSDLAKGAMYLGAGLGIAMLLKGPYEEAKKLAQAKADFSNLNLSNIDNTRVFGTAANLAHKTLGTTITDNIKLIQDF